MDPDQGNRLTAKASMPALTRNPTEIPHSSDTSAPERPARQAASELPAADHQADFNLTAAADLTLAARLERERAVLRTMIDLIPAVIYAKDTESRFVACNELVARGMGTTPAHVIGKTDFDFFPREMAEQFFADEQAIIKSGQPLIDHEEHAMDQYRGMVRVILTSKVPVRDSAGNIIGIVGTGRDITDRKEAERRLAERTRELALANNELSEANDKLTHTLDQLHRTQKQLMDLSRKTGMADVATAVLHNVGNVLNSLNLSADIVLESHRRSKVKSLRKVVDLLSAHKADPVAFLTADPRGKSLPVYLEGLVKLIDAEYAAVADELQSLQKNVAHIKVIVDMQQSNAKLGGMLEELEINSLLDDALRFNLAAHEQLGITVTRDYGPPQTVMIDRHKVFQIVMNLLSNAKHALHKNEQGHRNITVRAHLNAAHAVVIQIEDNGVGIPDGNITQIFTYGFTTKPEGHGFGLHSSANAAREMGGSLQAESDGAGMGARFTLTVPAGRPNP
jgi:PAS domain S-box-containing protein